MMVLHKRTRAGARTHTQSHNLPPPQQAELEAKEREHLRKAKGVNFEGARGNRDGDWGLAWGWLFLGQSVLTPLPPRAALSGACEEYLGLECCLQCKCIVQ